MFTGGVVIRRRKPIRPVGTRVPDKYRINQAIRAPQLRVISYDGQVLGIISVEEALKAAEEAGLDLVEVAPTSDPPVAKIMDYGKFKYQMGKRERETRKKQTTVKIKEVKMGPKIGEHDFLFKRDHCAEFLKEGHKLKVTVKFRGREMSHTELGQEILDRMTKALADVGRVEAPPRLEGRNMSMLVVPKGHVAAPPAGN